MRPYFLPSSVEVSCFLSLSFLIYNKKSWATVGLLWGNYKANRWNNDCWYQNPVKMCPTPKTVELSTTQTQHLQHTPTCTVHTYKRTQFYHMGKDQEPTKAGKPDNKGPTRIPQTEFFLCLLLAWVCLVSTVESRDNDKIHRMADFRRITEICCLQAPIGLLC